MNLEKMTYLNKDGLRVTDSLIVASEFGMRPSELNRTIKRVVKFKENKVLHALKHGEDTKKLFLTKRYLAKDGSFRDMYEITEHGFYLLFGFLGGGTKRGVERRLDIYDDFVESFFMLREMVELQRKEYETAINHMQTIITNFIPIDEFTHISSVTDSPRVFAVHGYFTSKPNHRPVDKALLDAIDFCVKLPQIREALGKEILRHEANKIKEEDNPTPSTAFEHFVKKGFFDNISETVYNAYESFINGWK